MFYYYIDTLPILFWKNRPRHYRSTDSRHASQQMRMDWNGLKWIQIFRNTDSWMLKWILFNPECIFIHLYELHRAYLYAFQSKNNINIFYASWILNSELWIESTVFLIQLNSKIISAISVQREYCSIQYSEYKMQFFNLIE